MLIVNLYHPESYTEIPVDIIYVIVDIVSQFATPSSHLKKCSLISRDWTIPCQQHLFLRFVVGPKFATTLLKQSGVLAMFAKKWGVWEKYQRFSSCMRSLKSRCDILGMVREAAFDGEDMSRPVEHWDGLLSIGFNNLRSLSVTRFDVIACTEFDDPYIRNLCALLLHNSHIRDIAIFNQALPSFNSLLEIITAFSKSVCGMPCHIAFDSIGLGYTTV
jgi:hypothetical protein